MTASKCSWCDKDSYHGRVYLNSGSYPRPMYPTAAICGQCAWNIVHQEAALNGMKANSALAQANAQNQAMANAQAMQASTCTVSGITSQNVSLTAAQVALAQQRGIGNSQISLYAQQLARAQMNAQMNQLHLQARQNQAVQGMSIVKINAGQFYATTGMAGGGGGAGGAGAVYYGTSTHGSIHGNTAVYPGLYASVGDVIKITDDSSKWFECILTVESVNDESVSGTQKVCGGGLIKHPVKHGSYVIVGKA